MKRWDDIAEHLRGQGWNLSWFGFIDRDGQRRWRACARNSDQRHVTIQADDLPEAMTGLERFLSASLDRAESAETAA